MEGKKYSTYFDGINNEKIVNSNFWKFIKYFVGIFSRVFNNFLISI